MAATEAQRTAALEAVQSEEDDWWSAYLERKAELDAIRAQEEAAERRREAERWR